MRFDYDKFAKAIKAKMYRPVEGYRPNGVRYWANQIGISSATLSRVTNGKCADLDTTLKICTWLEIEIEHFINPL